MPGGLSRTRIVRRKELAEILGVSEVTVWRWHRQGLLPPKRRIGPNSVGWLASEIDEWWQRKVDGAEDEVSR